ncbi:hypothetical protein D3C76_1564020 [compost metagenome]
MGTCNRNTFSLIEQARQHLCTVKNRNIKLLGCHSLHIIRRSCCRVDHEICSIYVFSRMSDIYFRSFGCQLLSQLL